MRTKLGIKYKKKKTSLIMPIFIAATLVLSVIAFSFVGNYENNQQDYRYNGHEFKFPPILKEF